MMPGVDIFERVSIRKRAIADVASLRRSVLTVDFILMALVEQKDSIALKVFDELRLDTQRVRRKLVDKILEQPMEGTKLPVGRHPLAMTVTRDVQLLFEQADRERKKLGDS